MTMRIFIVLALMTALAAGCRSKQPKPEANVPSGTAQDTNIQNQDMTYGAQGSDSGKIEGLYSIHFDYDKSNLTSEGRSQAEKDAKWMKAHAGTKLQIEGHCDRHGSTEYNLALGERRAKTVKSYMVSLGIKGNRLSTISYGKERLLDTSETEEADAKNRRANFVIQGQ